MINTPKITYVITYKHKLDRLANLRRVLEWLAPFQGMDVILVEQDTHSKISELNLRLKHIFIKNEKPYFNKSWAYNVALNYITTPIVIFGDADLIMNPNDFVQSVQMLDKFDVVNPYKSVIDLTPQESIMDLNSVMSINRIGRGEADNDIEKCPLAGGIVMYRREALYKIGGYNEDMLGWGGEDTFMDMKIKQFLTYIEMPFKTFHFYHEKAQIDPKLYERNLSILNHFAQCTKEQYQQHINMVLPKIGKLNKYS